MTQVDFWILGIICGLVLAYYLLKCYRVYRTDGALLLDMTNKKLYNLKFDIEMPHNCKVYLAILVAFVFGFVVAFFLFGGGKFF
ncbi:hypothetical protein M1N06_05225 [Peptococcaceae bacterium]|nr:hypothetical protein [Peptococcaceae bacterium]